MPPNNTKCSCLGCERKVTNKGMWCGGCMAAARLVALNRLYRNLSIIGGPATCLEIAKDDGFMTYRLQMNLDVLQGTARHVAHLANCGSRMRELTGETGILCFGTAPGSAEMGTGVDLNRDTLIVGVLNFPAIPTKKYGMNFNFDQVGGGGEILLQSMGFLLSLCRHGNFFAMLQGDDDADPNSTLLYMQLQEMAKSDPHMRDVSTQRLLHDVKQTKAIRLGIRQMYIWKVMCDNPKSLYADTDLLDAVWDSLSDDERFENKLLHRNVRGSDSQHTYGSTF